MSKKKKVFISGDPEQQLREFRNRFSHGDTSKTLNFDLALEGKGEITFVELKRSLVIERGEAVHLMSTAHVLPRKLGMRGMVWYVGAGASSDDPADLIMPEIGQKLLPFILPRKLREAVAGDLAEDFRKYAAQWGRPYAVRWLSWELAGLCIRRFAPTAIAAAIGAWFHQKLGW